MWRPNPKCECGHGVLIHPSFQECNFCNCKRYKSFKIEQSRAKARQKLEDQHMDSKLERRLGNDLQFQKDCGEILELERQFKIEFYVNGRFICRHYVDYRAVHSDGSIVLYEGKGIKDPTYLIKRNLLEAIYLKEHPEVGYVVRK